MASHMLENESGDVDFDFFETPRKFDSPKKQASEVTRKPPASKKHGDEAHDFDTDKGKTSPKRRYRSKSSSDSDSSDDESIKSVSSRDSSSERVVVTSKNKDYNYSDDTFSESSSAYSDGSSSDDDDREKVRKEMTNVVKKTRERKKKTTTAYIEYDDDSPRKQAWNENLVKQTNSKTNNKKYVRKSPGSDKDGSDSEMTDVSPLSSPRESPEVQRKYNHSKQNGKVDQAVQYNDSKTESGDIKLDNNNLNLSVLMKAVSEIEYERQHRLKANTRRVMFEPPKGVKGMNKDLKNNYSFDTTRVSLIEKENQRLLREIMKHVNSKKKSKPVVVHAQEPLNIRRITASAVNRQREQRRIEAENMQLLRRLNTSKASKGMARDDQLHEYQRTMLYGVPVAAVHFDERSRHYEQMHTLGKRTNSLTSVNSSGTGRRRRPWSGKSDASSTMSGTGRSTIRLRPGSAKSITSTGSRTGSRPSSAKSNKSVDLRPPWDDRFSFS